MVHSWSEAAKHPLPLPLLDNYHFFKVHLHYATLIFDIDMRHRIDRFDVECRCRMPMSRSGGALSTLTSDINYAIFSNCRSRHIAAIRVDLCRLLCLVLKQPITMHSNAKLCVKRHRGDIDIRHSTLTFDIRHRYSTSTFDIRHR